MGHRCPCFISLADGAYMSPSAALNRARDVPLYLAWRLRLGDGGRGSTGIR